MTWLWTPQLRRNFHEAVETLHAITENPSEEKVYRDSLPDSPSTDYTLRLGDELQLADHIAFLAHSQEGARAISAACVEDCDNGLVIRLASNSTPSEQTEDGLTKILNTFSNGARRGTPGAVLEEMLFEDVLNLSQDRILQRIRPPWVRAPIYYRSVERPLWVRIQNTLTQITSSRDPTPYYDLLSRLEAFISSARDLEFRLYDTRLRDVIKNIIRSCTEISCNGGFKSLEQQIVLHGRPDLVTKEVLQIDKLARYFGLCRDLGKLSQRCGFHKTTKTVRLQHLEALGAEKPKGASRICHVHAEVQLILHYEQYPTQKPPRAIGCSKSACFLCDILIQKLGKYCISTSHRRLYNQWTINNVCWMKAEQVLYFRGILQVITADLSRLAQGLGALDQRQLQMKRFGLESRAVLQLSSNSSLDDPPGKLKALRSESVTPQSSALTITRSKPTTVQANTALPPEEETATVADFTLMQPSATLSCLSLPAMLDLSKHDLPHHQKLSSKAETRLDLGKLMIIFECAAIPAGSLSVRKVEANGTRDREDEVKRIQVADIPNTEMLLRSAESSKMMFRLQAGCTEVEVEIVWQ